MTILVSLFAGIGGIDLAFENVGIHTAAAVELDPAARGVIADRMPGTTLMTDVTEVTGDDLRAAGFDPRDGILAAGWPCQGNSVAGRRGGMDDPRSGLWRHVVRLVAETRPRWFLGENVPGLFTVNDGRDFGAVIRDLDDLGYGVAWRVLDAQHFGVPQRRRRVFIVGCAGDGAAPAQVLLEPESRSGDSAPGREAGTKVAATLTSGSHCPGSNAPGRRAEDDVNLVGSLTRLRLSSDEAAAGHVLPVVANSLLAAGNDKGDETRMTYVAYALRANPGGTGQGHNVNYVTHPLTSEGADASENGTGRGTPLITATLTSPDGGSRNDQKPMTVDGVGVRRLTPLECERLQGFPDGWTATSNGRPQSDSARYRQLGNAVAVPCVEWIARRALVSALEGGVT